MKTTFLAVVLLAAIASSSNAAEIQPVAVGRFVTGSALAFAGVLQDTDSGTVHSADPQPFQESVAFHAAAGSALSNDSADQLSEILPSSVTATGTAVARAWTSDATSFGSGRARSRVDLTFTLADSSAYSISGLLEAESNGNSYVHLTSGAVVYHNFYATDYFPNVPFSSNGILPPGEYRLVADAASTAWADISLPHDHGSAGYDLRFDVDAATSLPTGGPGNALFLSIAPSPVRSDAVVFHRVPAGERATLRVFDVAGRVVRVLANGATDEGSLQWDGRNDAGRDLPPGVYFVRLDAGNRSVRKKVLLVD